MTTEQADLGVLAHTVATAATSVAGVDRLASVGPVEVATYFAGGKVSGVRFGDDKVWVHIVLNRLPVGPVAEAVQAAVGAALASLDQHLEVVVMVDDLELDRLPSTRSPSARPRKAAHQ